MAVSKSRMEINDDYQGNYHKSCLRLVFHTLKPYCPLAYSARPSFFLP